MWSMDDWRYLERDEIVDPQGRVWSASLMDLLGQEDDPEKPSMYAEAAFASGRYFTILYSASGSIQYERGHTALERARDDYERLLRQVSDGSLDPTQPVFRADLED